MSGPARLVLGEGANAVRRQVGPISWAALEVLVALGDGDGRAVASVRYVADELGISKNAGHRAIRRLVDAGLAFPLQERSTDGRFLVGSYRLEVPIHALQRVPVEPTSTAPIAKRTSRRSTATRRHPTDDPTQLSLLTS
jgi:DNA-binding IclR family transcriptional regulator